MLVCFMGAMLASRVLPSSAPSAQARAVVERFAEAADARDLDALESVLHPDFRVSFVVKGTAQAQAMDRASYLGLAREGKIGGDRRRVKISSVEVNGELAFVRVRLTGAAAQFESMQTLLLSDGQWRVLNETVLFSPKS